MKPVIMELFSLSRDAIHMHVGFACLIAVILFTKKEISSFQTILPGFLFSLLMELMDVRDDYSIGRGPDIVAGIHDLINTNFIPLVICILAKMKRLRLS